jgi:hypothetical protein
MYIANCRGQLEYMIYFHLFLISGNLMTRWELYVIEIRAPLYDSLGF